MIVGAAKCGTTSLYHYLRSHPNIYMPRMKEPMFFVSDIYTRLSREDPRHQIADEMVISSFKDYLELFDKANAEETARGEASAAYLYYHEMSIPRIKKCLGDIKIIIILRNPVERAYSSYTHLVRDGVESFTFEEFLMDEENRKKDNWDILNYPKSLGLYYGQVKAFMDSFSKVKIVLLDDLIKDPNRVLEGIYEFLGVDVNRNIGNNVETKKVFNRSSVPRYRLLHRVLVKQPPLVQVSKSILKILLPEATRAKLRSALHEMNKRKPASLNTNTRVQLERVFKEDISKTQELISRDLSHWVGSDAA